MSITLSKEIEARFNETGVASTWIKTFPNLSQPLQDFLLGKVLLTDGETPIIGGQWPEARRWLFGIMRLKRWLLITNKTVYWGSQYSRRKLDLRRITSVMEEPERNPRMGRGYGSIRRLTLPLTNGRYIYLPVKGGGAVVSLVHCFGLIAVRLQPPGTIHRRMR